MLEVKRAKIYSPTHKILKLCDIINVCSQKIRLSLLVLLFGVGVASVTDLQLNFLGTILSFLAILTTCVGQIVCISLIHLKITYIYMYMYR